MNTCNLITIKFGEESLVVSAQQLFLNNIFFIRKKLIIHKIFIENDEYWIIPHFPFENYLYLICPNALSMIKYEPEHALDCLALIYLMSWYKILATKADANTRQTSQAIIKKLKAWTKEKLKQHPLKEKFTLLNKQMGKHFPPLMTEFPFIPKFYVLHTDKNPPLKILAKCADILITMWGEKNSDKDYHSD